MPSRIGVASVSACNGENYLRVPARARARALVYEVASAAQSTPPKSKDQRAQFAQMHACTAANAYG